MTKEYNVVQLKIPKTEISIHVWEYESEKDQPKWCTDIPHNDSYIDGENDEVDYFQFCIRHDDEWIEIRIPVKTVKDLMKEI